MRSILFNFIYRTLKAIVGNLYNAGVFDVLTNKNRAEILKNGHLKLGDGCDVDKSAILIFNENSNIVLSGGNRIGRHTELQPCKNGIIKIGYGTSIQDRNIILGEVEFGKYCLTAPNVYISSGRHYFDQNPLLYIKDQDAIVHSTPSLSREHSRKVIVEDDVWLGINSVVMPGITIGRGSVIGANSVVTKNVEPFSIMAGAPARLIRKRLNLKTKQRLSFENDDDLPNFYQGFFLKQAHLAANRLLGGIGASHSFKTFMSAEGGTLRMNIRSLKSRVLTIEYNNQLALVEPSDLKIISFNRSNAGAYHHFKLIDETPGDDNDQYFLVSEIEITK